MYVCVCPQHALPVSAADGHVPLPTRAGAQTLADAHGSFQSACTSVTCSLFRRLTSASHSLCLFAELVVVCVSLRVEVSVLAALLDSSVSAVFSSPLCLSPQERLGAHSSAGAAGGGGIRQHHRTPPERSPHLGAGGPDRSPRQR